MGATCFKEHALPDSTANGITYPVPGDYVKAAEFASKLAKDFETLALTADQAIVAGVAQGIIPVLSGYVKPQPIPSGTDLLTLDTGWWYNRLTSVAGTMLNRPQGVTDGPFMVHMVRTPFGHSTITYYGYSGTAGGLFENHTGNAAHTAWVGWRRLDGTTSGGITQGSGLAGFANILRTQMFRDAMGSVTTGGKGAIAFRFDHGLSKFNSIMRPLLEARGIKYSLALSARNFNAGENAGVTASMVNSWTGAEVWNHGANQHQDESSVAGLTDQIVTGLTELQAALPNKQIWGYAVPGTGGSGQGGFFGGATAEQFYETAAGDLILTNHAVSSGSMSGTSRRPLDGRIRQGMAHFTIEAQTVARIKSEIDNAISNKTGNQLMMHPNLLNTEGYLTTAQLVEVLDYVVAKRDAGDLVVLSPYEMLVAQLSTSGGSGVPGPPGAGVPAGGEALQVIRKNAFNTTTEWATLTKSLVGLSNVDNTSDMNKPVSTMQKLALDEKLDTAALSDEMDPLNATLIGNQNSLTNVALSAAIDGSVAPVAEDVALLSVTKSPVLDMPLKARTFHSAFFNAARGRALRIAVIGSSTNEGAGTNHLDDRWVDHLGMRLQRSLLVGDPVSQYQTRFYPALWMTQTFINPVKAGSTRDYLTDPTFVDWYGPAGRDVRLELGSTPGTITFTVYGRRVRLWHSKSGSLGIPHYSIDGGADVALPTQNNATITAGHRTAWIDLGSLGQHTFTVKANLQNSVMVSGLEVSTVATDAEESNQVHIYEMSRSGTEFLTTAGVNSWMNPSWKALQYEWLKTANPDLIIMGAGSNAYAFGLATPAQIETNVRTFISEAQTAMGTYPSWLLVGQQERQPPASPLAPWADYLTALERIAADTSGVSFIDWTDHIPAYDDDATFYADIAHVNRLGHALAGYHTAAKLTGG